MHLYRSTPFSCSLPALVRLVAIVTLLFCAAPRDGSAATGDSLASFDAASTAGIPACTSGIGTGLAYDGTNLILSCWGSNVLERVNAATHLTGGPVTITGLPFGDDIRAIAWDATRSRLWACNGSSQVVLIDVSTGTVDNSIPSFPVAGCTDGLAYDGSDDTLWVSPDAYPTTYHYSVVGGLLGSFSNVGLIGSCGNSGIAVGGPNLYLANNGCSQIYTVAKDFTSSTLFASFPARLEDLECDGNTFAPLGAIWSIDAYDRTVNAWEIAPGLCTFGGLARCGDGTLDAGEQCDDGNLNNGDGCNSNCQLEGAICGNGTVESGEQCDDGNLNNGDGCSNTCHVESGGCVPTDCNDNNACTDDHCDTSGASPVCVHDPNNGACSDGNPCTENDTCDGQGHCVSGTPVVCLPPEDCQLPGTCDPQLGCVYPSKPDGTLCSDEDPCTTDDECRNGECTGDPRNCADDNPCTVDTCDGSGGAFLCVHQDCTGVANSNCPASCQPIFCGNGHIDAGETCDPPDATPDPDRPGEVKCRPDCTRCGDAVTQTSDGETCDDGNIGPSCDPRHPVKPFDACQNNCTPPICNDPSRIILSDGIDRFDFHGRVTPVAPATTIDPSNKTIVLQLSDAWAHVVFRASLDAGAVSGNPFGTKFQYKNGTARTAGGIAKLKMSHQGDGSYRVSATAFSELSAASSLMQTHVFIANQEWTIAGQWEKRVSGWRFRGE